MKPALPTACWLSYCLCLGCAPALRTPPTGPFPLNARFSIVDFPPPPALVQTVPPDPGEACSWVDGYFTWQGRRWVWIPGAWSTLLPDCYRTPAAMAWVPTDSGAILYYAEPAWNLRAGQTTPLTPIDPHSVCGTPAKTSADCRQR